MVDYMHIKEVIAELQKPSYDVCGECGGTCCKRKKERFFNGSDLRLLTHSPINSAEGCEYLGELGCILPIIERPSTCIEYSCHRLYSHIPDINKTILMEEINRMNETYLIERGLYARTVY